MVFETRRSGRPYPDGRALTAVLSLATTVLGALTIGASAHEFAAGDLRINHPWSRQTPPNAVVGAGYVKITNEGSESDRLVGGSSVLSQGFEIHTSQEEGGVVRMRPLDGGLVIAAGETVELKPLGTHIMLTGLTAAIDPNAPFEGTLVFERAGTVEVVFAVEPLGAASASQEHSGHGQ